MTEPLSADGYDIIGDVHGHAAKLHSLLAKLDYEQVGGVWRHSTRRAVFVGDLIDRGPAQLEAVATARAMVEAGSAQIVLANHEFNAIAWASRDPANPHEYLRRHNVKHYGQHEAFLDQVGEWSGRHHDILGWFKTLPLWLDLDGLRVVHACWDPEAMADIAPMVDSDNSLTKKLVVAASKKGTPAHQAIEHLLKGPEIEIPVPYLDKGDHPRHHARFGWWLPGPCTLRTHAVIPEGTKTSDGEPYPELPDTPIDPPVAPYGDKIPVFYGHYWETGDPKVTSDHTACVDYSAGKGGALVAYRWSGESTLDSANFVASEIV